MKSRLLISTHSPRLANSMLFTAVALEVPTIMRKLATTSKVSTSSTSIFPWRCLCRCVCLCDRKKPQCSSRPGDKQGFQLTIKLRKSNVQTHIGIQGQAAVSSAYLYKNSGISHGAHQKSVVISGIELYFQHRRWKPILVFQFAG